MKQKLILFLECLNNKNEDIGNYNKKYASFFEEFYIVGVDKLNLSAINNEIDVIRPSLLYKHTMGTFHKDRDCVIKDFWFPSGIQVQEINLSKPELETSLNEVFNKIISIDNFLKTKKWRGLLFVHIKWKRLWKRNYLWRWIFKLNCISHRWFNINRYNKNRLI